MAKSERHELCEEIVAQLSAQGMQFGEEALALMEPLLEGHMDYDQHRAWLESMASELELVDD